MHYSKQIAFAEGGSPRQVQKLRNDWSENWISLTDNERKQLRRGQFAFGSIYPYTFDGLSNIATHYPELFQNHDENYYVVKLEVEDWCNFSMMKYQEYNKGYFIHELLKRGSTSDVGEAKYLRCIPIEKGNYISIQPLVIGFTQKTKEELSPLELKKLMNLKTFNECTKTIRTVTIYVLKPLIDPIFEGYTGGWFSCPSALQAKIIHTLKTDKQHLFDNLEPLWARKYFLYLNLHDGSHDKNSVEVDAIDLCEHVAPSEINANGSYTYIRDWNRVREKLEKANKFFMTMETKGLMKGAKAYPITCPNGVYYNQETKKYLIYFKRSTNFELKK
jgi:hypothetical protein